MSDDTEELKWEPVGKAADWADNDARLVAIGARRIGVYRQGEKWYALKDACPHAGMPIHQGPIGDGNVTCPFHGWTFSLETGEGPMNTRATTYPVRITEAGLVEVGV